jgi:hypothetical protein
MMIISTRNDESMLTSASGKTPVPTNSTKAVDSDDVVLPKFAEIYADSNLLRDDSSLKSRSYESDVSGSLSERGYDSNNELSDLVVPEEVTIQDDTMSLSEKSFEAYSQINCSPDELLPDPPPYSLPEQVEVILPNHRSSKEEQAKNSSFLSLRLTYLIVTLVVMLADGLQGVCFYGTVNTSFFPCATIAHVFLTLNATVLF